MADQLASRTMGEASQDPAVTGGHHPADAAVLTHQVSELFTPLPSYHGRAISWIAVSAIVVAFIVGGLALITGPIWWLFWAGAGLAVAGFLVAAATNIMDDWY
jgi:hypothetical protein